MAFFQLMMSARRLEAARQEYHDEKLKSIEISKGKEVHYTLAQRIRLKKLMFKAKAKELWDDWTSCPENSWLHRTAVLLRTDGTYENFVLKSLIGFLSGILLTYMFFMFFVFQLNFSLSSATLLCSIFGIILTLGLAFSYRVRCVVFLLLPQFFSKRGRQALMAYAFILALTGPAKNTLHNIGVLSESLACGQEQLKEAVKTIVDLVKQPFYALRDAIAKVIKIVQTVVKKIKEALLAIKRMVLSILKVIRAVFQWLGSIVNMCNRKLGTPFERCEKVFEGAVSDCEAKLGPFFGEVCNLANIVGALCYVVKPLDFICELVSFIADTIVDAVRKKIKKFTLHMKAMFYVKVSFSHSFHFETNSSRTLEDVATGIVTEIRSRTDKFLIMFDYMSFVTSFFVLFMLLRVIHYRHKWLTNERFDNRYLTSYLRDIDLIRARKDKETVLPLNSREKRKYIPLTSITLISVEKHHLAKSVVFLGLTTFKLCIHMMVDYSLYWVLSTIRYHGRFETKVQQINSVGIFVSGDGYLAQLYRSIVRAFSPSDADIQMDALPCLPDPIPPNLDRYTQIISLILFCWIMAVFEPYGLRLRQVVMAYYHPDRAKQRAVWLYNHILRSRGSFIKYARRQLRRKFGIRGARNSGTVTFKEHLIAKCPILRKIFHQDEKMCLLCGATERDNELPHVRCPNPGCIGIFCVQCFTDLQNLCTICRAPMEYGDLSDMSEERDSSDDQKNTKFTPKVGKTFEVTGEEDEGICDIEETPDIDQTKGKFNGKEEEDPNHQQVEHDGDQSDASSTYSQSYQEETPGKIEPLEPRISHRDVEAQKLRDDVTIQIFNESLRADAVSSSGSLTGCFVLRAQKKLCTRKRFKRCPCRRNPPKLMSSLSASPPETDLDTTAETEDDEVINVKGDDELEENALLEADRSVISREESGTVKKIVELNRVSWISKRSSNSSGVRKRSSLAEKVIDMPQDSNHEVENLVHTRQELQNDGDPLVRDFSGSSLSIDRRYDESSEYSRSHSHAGTRRQQDVDSFSWSSHRERKNIRNKKCSSLLESMSSEIKYFEVNELTGRDDKTEKHQKNNFEKMNTINESDFVESNDEKTCQVFSPEKGLYNRLVSFKIFGIKSKARKMKEKFSKNKIDDQKTLHPEILGDGDKQTPDFEKFGVMLESQEEIRLDNKICYHGKSDAVKLFEGGVSVKDQRGDFPILEKTHTRESSFEVETDEFSQGETTETLEKTPDFTDEISESLCPSDTDSDSTDSSQKKVKTKPMSFAPRIFKSYRRKFREKKKCPCSQSPNGVDEKKQTIISENSSEELGQRVSGFHPIIYPDPLNRPQSSFTKFVDDQGGLLRCRHRKIDSSSQSQTQNDEDIYTSNTQPYDPYNMNSVFTSNTSCTMKPAALVLSSLQPALRVSELIGDLKECDRTMLSTENSQIEQSSDSVRMNEPSGLENQSISHSETASRLSENATGSEVLPFQSTEIFQQRIYDYRQLYNSGIPESDPGVEILHKDQIHLIPMSKSDDDSEELIKVLPVENRKRYSAITEIGNRFVNVFKKKKKSRKWSDISSSEIESHHDTTEVSSSEDETTH